MQNHTEVTVEEDEAFEELARKVRKAEIIKGSAVGEGFIEYGRKLEYLGHLLQQSDTSLKDLVSAARDVNFNLKFSVKQEVDHG